MQLTQKLVMQAFIIVLVICKNKEDPSKNESIRVVTTFFYMSMGFFQDAQGQLIPQSLVRSCRILNPSQSCPPYLQE